MAELTIPDIFEQAPDSRSAEHFVDDSRASAAIDKPKTALLVWVSLLTLCFTVQIVQLFPVLDGLQAGKIVAIVAFLVFIAGNGISSRVRLVQAPSFLLLLTFLGFAVVTLPAAIWPSGSLAFITGVYAKNVFFAYMLVQTIRSERDARAMAAVLAAGSALLAFSIFVGVGPLVTYKTDPGRFGLGGTYDPNDLALLFVVTIPFAFFRIKGSGLKMKLFMILCILVMLAGMVKTGSRGGFLGLVAIAICIFARSSRQTRKYTLAAIVLGMSAFAIAAPGAYWERVRSIYNYQSDYNLNEQGGRVAIWQMGLRMVAENPLNGVGISCYPLGLAEHFKNGLTMAAHNSFLQAAAELGVFGFLLFVGMIAVSIVRARAIRRQSAKSGEHPEAVWIASAVEVAFIGFIVSAFFLSHAYSPIFCFLIGMAGSLQARFRQARSAQPTMEVEYV